MGTILRDSGETWKQTTVYLSEEEKDILSRLSKKTGVPQNTLCRAGIKKYCENYDYPSLDNPTQS